MSDLIDVSVAAEMTGLSEQTIYRRTRQGTFPKPLLVDTHLPRGPKKLKRWVRQEVAGWMLNNGIDNKANGKAQAEDASFIGMIDDMDKDMSGYIQWVKVEKADAWYEANKYTLVPFIVAAVAGFFWILFA